jgi:hypothetical protein
VNVRAFVTEAFGFLRVGAIEFRVMLQFARLRDAGIEAWRSRESSSRRRDSSRSRPSLVSVTTVVPVEAGCLHQPGVAQLPEFTVTWVQRLIDGVAEIARRHDAKSADGGQRARFGAAQGAVVAVMMDVPSFEATRQVDVLHEHVARVHTLPVAWG